MNRIMKKTVLLLIALLTLGTAQESMAQQRWKTTTATRTTNRPKTNITTKAPTPIVRTIAKYDVGASWLTQSKKLLLFLEFSSNNAVMYIDKNTGTIGTLIPGIDKVYEDVRPAFMRITCSGEKLFIVTKDKGEIYLYDGKSFETSVKMVNWSNILCVGDNFMAVENKQGVWEVWDTAEMKRVVSFPHGLPESVPTYHFSAIGPDGSMWFTNTDKSNLRLVRVQTDGKISYHSLANQTYLKRNLIDKDDYWNDENMIVKNCGNYIYFAYLRRIYRLNMLNPETWEEYVKIPADQAHDIKWYRPDSNGNILLQGDCFSDNKEYNTEFFRAGSYDNPQQLGHRLKTGLRSGYSEETLNLAYAGALVDENNNFIILDNNRIYVYNPNNVIGYSSAIGKTIEKKK